MTHIIVNETTREALLVGSPDWEGDWQARYFPGHSWQDVVAYSIYGKVGSTNVLWSEELASSAGSSFFLFADESCSAEEIEQARRKIRQDRDVVRMRVFKLSIRQEVAA